MDMDIIKRFICGAKEAHKKVDNHSFNFPITIESAFRLATNIEELLKEQEPKTGHWVEQQINSYTRSTTCSVCGGSAPFVFVSSDRYGRYGCGKDELTKYCPNCGAEMKGETEVEID